MPKYFDPINGPIIYFYPKLIPSFWDNYPDIFVFFFLDRSLVLCLSES